MKHAPYFLLITALLTACAGAATPAPTPAPTKAAATAAPAVDPAMAKLQTLLRDQAYAREMAEYLDAAYYKSVNQPVPAFLKPEEETATTPKLPQRHCPSQYMSEGKSESRPDFSEFFRRSVNPLSRVPAALHATRCRGTANRV